MKAFAQAGVYALQLFLVALEPGNIRKSSVNIVLFIIINKCIVNRAPDHISLSGGFAHGDIRCPVSTDMICQQLSENPAVLRPGVDKQVFAVHQFQGFFLSVTLHHPDKRRGDIFCGNTAVIFLLQKTGDVVHLVYNLHEILVRQLAVRVIHLRNIIVNHIGCFPFF